MNKEMYRKLTSWLIAAWFIFALLASSLHLFQVSPGAPPVAFGSAALLPIIIFMAWFSVSPSFRAFVLGLNPRTLTMVQSWRIAGYVFLVLYAYGILPGAFAMPAGWGDVAIGVTAPLIALKLVGRSHRAGFIFWQILGMADLVTALGSGVATGFLGHNSVAMAPVTVLPLSLIPTFGVPLFFIFHIICIAQAKQWRESVDVPAGRPLANPAV
ncbi:hypothetical protein [Alloacidobacterium sp.]|uniref:hypothetical protein n=1 Tax=Alloacidobacterium sp. TaxID=2951999 RepID=UPI002D50182E|nr:hypothetical protein [Alloacidobacterium sp.]HYK36216.1 hypothetical protein [Alloacidobacterium sp.]